MTADDDPELRPRLRIDGDIVDAESESVEPVKRPDDPADADEAGTSALLEPLSPKVKRIIYLLLTVLIPGAIAYFVYANWDTFSTGPWEIRPHILAVAGILYLVSEGLPPLAWASLMRSAGSPAPNLRSVCFVWFAVEPLKYLPIPAGPIMGRYALAHRVGLDPVPAIVTLAYEWAITFVITITIAFPGFIWLAFFVEPGYRWAIILILAIIALIGFSMLRPGGLSRTIGEMVGNRNAFEGKVKIDRRAIITPAIVVFVAFAIRICAAGFVLVALTPADPVRAPLYGLVFVAGATMPFSRFGTREAAIVVGLRALDFASGPAALAALLSRAFGLVTALLLLGVTAAIGGGRKVDNSVYSPQDSTP